METLLISMILFQDLRAVLRDLDLILNQLPQLNLEGMLFDTQVKWNIVHFTQWTFIQRSTLLVHFVYLVIARSRDPSSDFTDDSCEVQAPRTGFISPRAVLPIRNSRLSPYPSGNKYILL